MITYGILLTGAGGALGAVTRGYLGKFIGSKFPWATLIVNVVGSFLVGFLIGTFAGGSSEVSKEMELISLGFCGGFTTFSSFSFQTIELLRAGKRRAAALNIALSLVLSLFAAWLGIVVSI